MKRRHFLGLAGAAGLSRIARSQGCANPPLGCSGWSRSLSETGDLYPATRDANPGTIEMAGAIPFQPANGSYPRRAWSSIDPRRDAALLQQTRDGYCKMRSLPASDPRSLLRQTWLHDYYCGGTGAPDLHSSWAFLPWHRAFLYFHEEILRTLIGKPQFRLPYWDWDRQGQIPSFFTDLGLPDFLINSAGRSKPGPSANWADKCIQQAWMMSDSFTAFAGPGDPNDSNANSGLAVNGPHGMAHAFVGGAMRNPATAAADPLFFAHHGNVDRFWSYWQQQYNYNPPNDYWTQQPFLFYNSQCRLVRVTPADVSRLENLGYSYDTMPPVHLCPFQSINIQLDDLLNPASLVRNLKQITLAGLLSRGSSAVLNFADYLTGTIRYADILPECFVSFPVQIALTLSSAKLKTGQYYVVGLKRERFHKLGGFGVFASPNHLRMQTDSKFIATGCLDPKLYKALLNRPFGFNLVFGESSDGTDPDPAHLNSIDPEDWLIKLLYPQGYLNTAKGLLGNFGIP